MSLKTATVKVDGLAMESNGFLEYLQLQDGEPDLVTKSELMSEVRAAGFSVSDRQLTFYISEELLPRSVRVGSRAGAYPRIVVELLMWILRARDGGVPIEALKELLPVWKYLVRARSSCQLNLAELEYVARQHVTSLEGSIAVPQVVGDVLRLHVCTACQGDIRIVYKDGAERYLTDPQATVGFAIARVVGEEDEDPAPRWYAGTRISLAPPTSQSTDPTTVILGLKPNAPLPADFTDSTGLGARRQDEKRKEAIS